MATAGKEMAGDGSCGKRQWQAVAPVGGPVFGPWLYILADMISLGRQRTTHRLNYQVYYHCINQSQIFPANSGLPGARGGRGEVYTFIATKIRPQCPSTTRKLGSSTPATAST